MIYWTYIDTNGEQQDYEFETRLEAVHQAEEDFEEANSELSSGISATGAVTLVSFNWDSQETLTREIYTVYAEGVESDYNEHSTHWGL